MSTAVIEAPQTGTIVPLSSIERLTLADCERDVEQGLETFYAVGQALAKIRDGKLYREEFGTFEEYCQQRWDMSARRARQLWSAAEVVEELVKNNMDHFPLSESQARPLTMLPIGQRAEAWAEALRTAPNGKMTASHVASIVQQRLGKNAENPNQTKLFSDALPKTPVIDAGPKEDNLKGQTARAIAEVRKLIDMVGTPGAAAAADLGVSLTKLEQFQDHTARVETTWAERRKK